MARHGSIITLPYVPYGSVHEEFLGGPRKSARLGNI